jgi:tRNA/tmRNA/rRNA uracil-C5-methylase (TrmA/RlmC/RlmD family)
MFPVLDLDIEKPAAGGRMIARHDGQITLVAGAIPGERVRARVERTSKGVIYATTVDVLQGSSDRRAVAGDPLCGGNVYAHVKYPRQLAIKGDIIADAFARIARLPLGAAPSVTGSEERGYRMRARFHARGGHLGFFREGTHDICDPATTGQLLPESVDVLDRLRAALGRADGSAVTSIEFSENMPADQRAVHLEVDRAADFTPIAEEVGNAVTGLTYSGPFSGLASIVAGSPVVSDRILVVTQAGECAVALQRHVRGFFQGNRYLLPTLVARVVSLVDAGPAVDLYAGAGLFGVALAACGRAEITAVEGDRFSAQDLKANAAPYGSAVRTVHQPVEAFLGRRTENAEATLIVDPPRTGMSREALNGIVAYGARAVVYVSCDVATLARDVRRLVDAGYVLEHIEAFDLFPNTAHVEGVVKLTKK